MASSQPPINWIPLIIAVLIIYPAIQQHLRYGRERKQRRLFDYPDRSSLARMTYDDAWAIQKYLSSLEFPQLFELSLQFALFRTYGIPSISSLLVATGQFSSSKTASKRYADTMLIFSEFSSNPPSSDRTLIAIARMNFIHGVYQKAGKLSNDDMVYMICLASLGPKRWMERYEWRGLNEMEQCAVAMFWKGIADAMNIDFAAFQHVGTWRDALDWLDDAQIWCNNYEKRYMVPHPSNKRVADHTTDLLLDSVPMPFKQNGLKIVCCLMDDRLLKAMLYPDPPNSYRQVVSAVFSIRRLFLRYIALPRPKLMAFERVSTTADARTGKYYQLTWQKDPWYVQPTFANRWAPGSIWKWIVGGNFPKNGKLGEKFASEGYNIQEVGPERVKGKGEQELQESLKTLRKMRQGGCTFLKGS